MATESPLLHDGSQCVSNFDARNSSVTGTTLAGPSGSGQFLAVLLATTADRTIVQTSSGSTGQLIYGILQNKPSTGIAADVGIFGITKAVAASTTITAGSEVMTSGSSMTGRLTLYSTTVGPGTARLGRALESATTAGQVFTMALYGFGMGGGTIAATTA
jgi:hypothetical protein